MEDDHRAAGRDGRSLADHLATALDGPGAQFDGLLVTGERIDADLTVDGALAYSVGRDRTKLAGVFVHPDRIHVEFHTAPDRAASAGERAGLRVRPKAVRPPRTLVFVESPSEIESALDVFEAVVDTLE